MTIVLTTHDMDQAAKLSDRVGIIDDGKLLTLDSPASPLNPLTYVSEGVRACLAPQVPHLPFWLCALIVSVVSTLSALLGIRKFLRRALD